MSAQQLSSDSSSTNRFGASNLNTIKIGEKAPGFSFSEWIKKPEHSISTESGKIIVATFLSSKMRSISELIKLIKEISAKHKPEDVNFILILNEKTSDSFFPQDLPQNVYIAVDDQYKTLRLYFKGSIPPFFPYTFVVDQNGYLLWHGLPFYGLSVVVERAVSGKLNVEQLKHSFAIKKLADEYFALAKEGTYTNKIIELGDKILADASKDPLLLNEFAWNILSNPELKYRDGLLALKAARAACDIVKGSEPAFLDTYARALFVNNQIYDAIRVQQLAIELCSEPSIKSNLQQTLKFYQSKITNQKK